MIPRHDEKILQISDELARLLNERTEFVGKGAREGHTIEELLEYEKSRDRVRELFAQLERLRKAA